jgi:AcrR family transcriptional regulator
MTGATAKIDKRKLRGRAAMDKYMDAAEALFIRRGYDGTSIRAISADAGMNIATVVYHWGTKEALFRDVCIRRFSDIKAEQLRRLRLLDKRGERLGHEDLENVLRALVEPPLLMHSSGHEGQTIRLLYGRALTDPSQVILRLTIELFADASTLCRALMRKCLPELDDQTFYRRYTCALGAFVFTQAFGHRVSQAAGIDDVQADWPAVTDEIVAFMKIGLSRR